MLLAELISDKLFEMETRRSSYPRRSPGPSLGERLHSRSAGPAFSPAQ
jgi:hypothetical protein